MHRLALAHTSETPGDNLERIGVNDYIFIVNDYIVNVKYFWLNMPIF
jgi:hypothetical protein